MARITAPRSVTIAGSSGAGLFGILSHDRDADTYPWWEVTYRDSINVRIALADRYKPATVNKMLSALRAVLKQSWRLGYIDADA
jgi:hypothetical protein